VERDMGLSEKMMKEKKERHEKKGKK